MRAQLFKKLGAVTGLLLIIFLPEWMVGAEGLFLPYVPLVVEKDVVLGDNLRPYHLSSIHVKRGAWLRISQGVVILLAPGADIFIEGNLAVVGNDQAPVIFSAEKGTRWRTLRVSPQAGWVEIFQTRFEDFQGPLSFQKTEILLEGVSLQNGLINVVQIGEEKGEYGDIQLRNFRFINQRVGKEMKKSGLALLGSFDRVQLKNMYWLDYRPDSARDKIGIEIQKTVQDLVVDGLRFPYTCHTGRTEVGFARAGFLSPEQFACPKKDLPMVFVPGYGTSLNLSILAQEHPKPQLNGWHFIKAYNPGYADFLETLRVYEIPHEIAFYDWRLPAELAAEQYLKPIIQRVKEAYRVDGVYLVAHSFGGIVSRAYIQGASYLGDVAELIQLGSPNNGVVKAYSTWEAGELPEDWQVLSHLVRYYQYRFGDGLITWLQTIQNFFPSLQELQPIYPALFTDEKPRKVSELYYQNEFLLKLNKDADILKNRVNTLVVAGGWQPTQSKLAISPPFPAAPLWKDGKLLEKQPEKTLEGDGTVPLESVRISGIQESIIYSSHAMLPMVAFEVILGRLFPRQFNRVPPEAFNFGRYTQDVLTFIFDCPIQVVLKLPDGKEQGVQAATPGESWYEENWGEFLLSADLIWLVVPQMKGQYFLTVKALEDTPVRGWVNDSELVQVFLKKGEGVVWQYETETGKFEQAQFLPRKEEASLGSLSETTAQQALLSQELPQILSSPALPRVGNDLPLATPPQASFQSEEVVPGESHGLLGGVILLAILAYLPRRLGCKLFRPP